MLFHHQLWINHKFVIQFFQFINKNEHSSPLLALAPFEFAHEKTINFLLFEKPKAAKKTNPNASHFEGSESSFGISVALKDIGWVVSDDEKLQQCGVIQFGKLRDKNKCI